MRALAAAVARYAQADANVLVTGETGVGKDLVARTLHQLSDRRQRALRRRRLPRPRADARRVGAVRTRARRLHRRHAGAARTLRDGRRRHRSISTASTSCRSTGRPSCCVWWSTSRSSASDRASSCPIRARIIASASRDIEQAVREGHFRMDLFHRLRVLPLRVPALRDRAGDSPSSRAASSRRFADTSGRAGARAFATTRSRRWRRTTGRATCASSVMCSSAR